MKNKVWLAIGSVFGIGYLPIMPGTYASLFSCILAYFIVGQWWWAYQVALYGSVFLLGVFASYHVEKIVGEEDPRIIVIDEYVGQGVALILAQKNIWLFLIGFLLFRVMDIIKPFPVNKLEKVHYGFGVMLDDLMAGFYAFLVVSILKLFL
jgi:phosphatidylglycerophosphatase A